MLETLQQPFAQTDYWGWIHGDITSAGVKRIISQMARWEADPNAHIHIHFFSEGGEVCAGIDLYEYFKAYPRKLTVYAGTANSIAAVAFLGAPNREVSKSARFILHSVVSTLTPKATIKELEQAVASASFNDNRVESILKEHIRLEPSHVSGQLKPAR